MLGAIADDFTGATDLACALRRSGHRVTVVVEDGDPGGRLEGLDAVVVALKTRTAPADVAVAASLDALARLGRWGADRFYVKYCSTFDSTDRGNIGPVLDAVADALDAGRVVVVPALPENGRTVVDGLLRVDGVLLEDSPMRDHPLTPMRRSRVSDLLRPQTRSSVGETHHPVVRAGAAALRTALDGAGARYVVVDAATADDLRTIARSTADDVLVSGGAGLALGLEAGGARCDEAFAAPPGRRVVLCGSASAATREQIAVAGRTRPVHEVDVVRAVRDPDEEVAALARRLAAAPEDATPVVCAARTLADVRGRVDGTDVAEAVEHVLSRLAVELVATGTSALLVAGGETSGAVVRALGVESLRIGPEIAPGVCWSLATTGTGRPVALALKSGGFGAPDLFVSAWGAIA